MPPPSRRWSGERNRSRFVGIGRPFNAEPDLAERILGGRPEPGLCQYSNLCVPAQTLGMKGGSYNPAVTKARRADHHHQPADGG